MIIEALTAFSAVKITWEMLEILHLVRVGHETAIDACRSGNSFINFRQKKLQEMAYKKDPLLRFVHEAKTDYDFQATGDAEKADYCCLKLAWVAGIISAIAPRWSNSVI